MKLSMTLATILLSAAPLAALADCEPTPAEHLPTYTESVLNARAKAFTKACTAATLTDMDDKRLAARASLAPNSGNPGQRINEDLVKTLPPGTVENGQMTTTIMTFVIETDGRISEATMVGRSGNRKYDSEVQAAARRAKTYAVMQLDGQPVRAFLTMTFSVGVDR